MIKENIEKGLKKISTKLTDSLHADYVRIEEIKKKLDFYKVKKVAVFLDDESDVSALDGLTGIEVIGYFTDSAKCLEKKIGTMLVKPLLATEVPIENEAWIINARNRTAYQSLLRFLTENKREQEVIIWHSWFPSMTHYYSFIDFFSNEVTTQVQIMNYFDLCHRYPFPLDIKYCLRDSEGQVVKAGQKIILVNGLKVISSSDFSVSDFVGYLEIEFELPERISSFLHYQADYTSKHFVASNHQAGLGLLPARSRFTRGYIPANPEESIEVCMFQRNYEEPVKVLGTVSYYTDGVRQEIKKELGIIPKGHLCFFDVKKIFSEIDFKMISPATVEVEANVPLHRPNYYYFKKGDRGFFNVEHAGPDPKTYCKGLRKEIVAIDEELRKKIGKYGVMAGELSFFVLPEEIQIESFAGLGNDSTCEFDDLTVEFYNAHGELVYSGEEKFDFQKIRFINLNEFLKARGVKPEAGIFSLRSSSLSRVPLTNNGTSGFRHLGQSYLTTIAASGGNASNIPFYFDHSPPAYFTGVSAASVTEIFGRGVSNEKFDTLFMVMYRSANLGLKKEIEYEVMIANSEGNRRIVNRRIQSHGADFFKLSDLIQESGHKSADGYYTVWLLTGEAGLYAEHLLLRKKDSAISVEHCYVGRFQK